MVDTALGRPVPDNSQCNEKGLPLQTCCPKCSTIVKSNGTEWEILNSSCPALVGTQWNGSPEYCPVLSVVVEPDVVLPGVAARATVQAQIDRVRVQFLK